MPLVKVEEQVFSLLIFFNMADIVGTTVATGSLTVDRWWQFAAYSHWRTDGVVLSGYGLSHSQPHSPLALPDPMGTSFPEPRWW